MKVKLLKKLRTRFSLQQQTRGIVTEYRVAEKRDKEEVPLTYWNTSIRIVIATRRYYILNAINKR